MIGIYKITNPKGEVYIGQSKDIEKRMQQYKYLQCTGQIKLYNSLKEYGFENHIVEVLESFDIYDVNFLLLKENYWIGHYDSVVIGLNSIAGAPSKFIDASTTMRISRVVPTKHHDKWKQKVNQFINQLQDEAQKK
jgi:group I intron endonuclease